MHYTRETALRRLTDAYRDCYDVKLHHTDSCDAADACRPVAEAAFHETGSGYVLSKKVVVYSAIRHEYVWIFSMEHLTKERYEACLRTVRSLGEPLVDPVKHHMSTNLVLLILCDTADEEAVQALEKCRIRKSFQLSLRGWMEVQTVMIEVGSDQITGNKASHHTAVFLKNVLHPKVKHKFIKRKGEKL